MEDLEQFLKLYYQGMNVLRAEQDYYELTMAYLARAHQEGVIHVEPFFDPQAHIRRGVSFETVINGIYKYARFHYKIAYYAMLELLETERNRSALHFG